MNQITFSKTKIKRYEDGSIKKESRRATIKTVLDRRAEPADCLNGGVSYGPAYCGSKVSLSFSTEDASYYLSIPAAVFEQFVDLVRNSEYYKPFEK